MYSQVLAAYQKSLLVFWGKTSKTMSAVAESFKGYQYYEFTVIKDLAEPSRLLAEKNLNLTDDKSEEKETQQDDTLIDINEAKNNQKEIVDSNEPINALIDIDDAQLDDQLLELEKLTNINHSTSATAKTTSESGENLLELSNAAAEHERLFSDLLSPSENTNSDLLGTNENNSFDAHWTAAFGKSSNQQISGGQADSATSNNTFLPSSFLNELLTSVNKVTKPAVQPSSNPKPKPIITTKATDKSSWLNLFAELDPIQNPDAIGKPTGDEADRSC
jgi:hypothetical protein